jgi:ABC-type nitrate/sulfonate/bicarbonate transport system ATPase subunit
MLQISDVHKSFTDRKRRTTQHVLRGVDLDVHPGEFVCLIGHSGCGKSTLLNVVGGLLAADRGKVTLDGRAVTEPGPDRAMVFQGYSLLPRLSLLANVREAAKAARPNRSAGQNDEVVERYLRAVGLWDAKDKKPAEVSGGMAQRAAVARAFAVQPRVLLLDEPFGALDALTRRMLQAELMDLWQHEEVDTEMVIMVTHGIEEAVMLADKILVLGNPPGPSVVSLMDVDLPRPRIQLEGAEGLAHRAAQQRLLSLLEIPAA